MSHNSFDPSTLTEAAYRGALVSCICPRCSRVLTITSDYCTCAACTDVGLYGRCSITDLRLLVLSNLTVAKRQSRRSLLRHVFVLGDYPGEWTYLSLKGIRIMPGMQTITRTAILARVLLKHGWHPRWFTPESKGARDGLETIRSCT